MALVHFDAHTDTYSQGSRYDHGTMFYHAPKEGLISAEHSIQIGIRTDYEKDGHPFEVVNGVDANQLSADEIVEKIKARVGNLPVYTSFDIDCLDPAFAPGVSHHEPGGMSVRDALHIIHSIDVPVIGADVVELNPQRDLNGVTGMVAAKLVREIAGMMLKN